MGEVELFSRLLDCSVRLDSSVENRYRSRKAMKDERLVEMRVFRAIVEHDGFTAAATALEVSQPFISRTIAALESRLGAQLLHRTTRRQRLTTEGERFLASCVQILDALDEAEQSLSPEDREPVGDLRVSAPLAFGTDQLIKQLPSFLAAYPKVTLRLYLDDAFVSLMDDNFDVAVRMGRLEDSSLVARKLCELRRIIVASPDYLRRVGTPKMPADLRHHNCLTWEGAQEHLNHWPFLVHGERTEFVGSGSFKSSNGTSLAEMCFAGVGIMRMAEHLALPAVRAGRLTRLLSEYEMTQSDMAIHAVYLAHRRPNARVRSFVDHLVQAFERPPWLQETHTHGA